MALYFFSGKGGVGKTHLATSFAMNRAQSGRKCLLIEFSEYAQFSEYFETEIGFEPKEFEKNLSLSTWAGKDCLGEYVAKVLHSQRAADFFIKMPLMEKLINAAPGLKEISVLGKLTSDYRSINFSTGFDDIVFDAPSSGHFISLLGVPESLGGLVGLGPMKKQSLEIQDCLQKNKDVHFAIINDGTHFAKKESEETCKKTSLLLRGKPVNQINNYSEGGPPYSNGKTWIESARNLSSYWDGFTWV